MCLTGTRDKCFPSPIVEGSCLYYPDKGGPKEHEAYSPVGRPTSMVEVGRHTQLPHEEGREGK